MPDPARRAEWMRRLARITGEGACRAALRQAQATLDTAQAAVATAEATRIAAREGRARRLRDSYDALPGQQAPHDIESLRACEIRLRAAERQAEAECVTARDALAQARSKHATAQAALRAAIQKRQRRTEIADRLAAEAGRAALAAEEDATADELADRLGHTAEAR